MLGAKLTSEQIEESVQKLIRDVYVGNGEPSLKQMIRNATRDIEDVRNLLLNQIEKWEKKEEEYYEEKLKVEQEKYKSLLQHQTDMKSSRIYWTRALGILAITQVLQWVFVWISP